jgi:hypothetical protein
VAERRRGGAAGSQVAQQAPAEEPFEQLAVPGIAGPSCSSSSWCPVTAMPSRICAVNQATWLTGY